MTILALVEAKIEPQRAKDVIRLLRGALPSPRSFEGCAGREGKSESEDSTRLVLVEQWDSKEPRRSHDFGAKVA
jgi:quinol monooxygenase YgiN